MQPSDRQLIETGRLAALGGLAAGAAHEINNPLFAILGFVEFLLLDAQPGTKTHERLELVHGTALEIKGIMRALLDFARERSDERAPISLAEVASQTVDLMRRTSAAKQVEIVECYTADDVQVEASSAQLKQMFVHLISNAKLALHETGGTITVEVGRDAAGAWAEVRHTGRDVDTTGLSLPISALIAEAHGGTLTVDENTFRLRLPHAGSAALTQKEAVS